MTRGVIAVTRDTCHVTTGTVMRKNTSLTALNIKKAIEKFWGYVYSHNFTSAHVAPLRVIYAWSRVVL